MEGSMSRKALAALAAAGSLLLLAACAPEVESSLYLSDVLKVAAEGGTISTPAVLRVPQSSKDDCAKALDGLIKNLAALAPTTGKGKCVESKSGDALAEIETSLVIARAGDAVPQPNLFVVEVAEEGSGSSLTFRMLTPIGDITKALVADSDQYSTDFDPSVFTIRIENDADGTVELYPNHVFVDDEPAGLPELGAVTLDRRKGATLRFSDVASVYVERANAYTFASIGIPQ
jgi:hypothetical protein